MLHLAISAKREKSKNKSKVVIGHCEAKNEKKKKVVSLIEMFRFPLIMWKLKHRGKLELSHHDEAFLNLCVISQDSTKLCWGTKKRWQSANVTKEIFSEILLDQVMVRATIGLEPFC